MSVPPAVVSPAIRRVSLEGDAELCAGIGDAVRAVLEPRRKFYRVRMERTGWKRDVLLRIDGSSGHAAVLLEGDLDAEKAARRLRSLLADSDF